MAVEAEENWYTLVVFSAFLIKESVVKISSRDIDLQLAFTKLDSGLSIIKYFYKMKQIGNIANIEKEAVVEYIIAGIIDTPVKKSILYTAKIFDELRKLLEIYEKVKNDDSQTIKIFQKNNNYNLSNNNNFTKKISKSNCFNYGSPDHKRVDCRNETKCFKCNKKGHMSNRCPNGYKYTQLFPTPATSAVVAES